MKKITISILSIVCAIAMFPLQMRGQENSSKPFVSFYKDTLKMHVGQLDTMRVKVMPRNVPVHWDSPVAIPVIAAIGPIVSSNPYDTLHLILARKVGKTKVIVRAGDAKDTCYVFVSPKIFVKQVRLNKDTIWMNAGQKATIETAFFPADASDKSLKWMARGSAQILPSSSALGEVLITSSELTDTTLVIAEAKDGSLCRDTCVVITRVPVDSIRLSKDTIRLNQGDKDTLRAIINPFYATDRSLTWNVVRGLGKVVPLDNVDSAVVITAPSSIDTTVFVAESLDAMKRDTCIIITSSSNPDGVMDVSAQRIWAAGSSLYLQADRPASLYIYTVSGMLYRREELLPGSYIFSLPRGLYIVAFGNTRKKIAIR